MIDMEQCPKCKHKFAKYPFKDENGKIIVKNLFRMDMMSILFFICVIFLLLGYKADMAQCNDAIKYPCTFCEKTNCCITKIGITNKTVETKKGFDLPTNFTIT